MRGCGNRHRWCSLARERRASFRRFLVRIEDPLQDLTRLESKHPARTDGNGFSRLRVSPNTFLLVPNDKVPKTTNLDLLTLGENVLHAVKDGLDNLCGFLLGKAPDLLVNGIDDFCFRHRIFLQIPDTTIQSRITAQLKHYRTVRRNSGRFFRCSRQLLSLKQAGAPTPQLTQSRPKGLAHCPAELRMHLIHFLSVRSPRHPGRQYAARHSYARRHVPPR